MASFVRGEKRPSPRISCSIAEDLARSSVAFLSFSSWRSSRNSSFSFSFLVAIARTAAGRFLGVRVQYLRFVEFPSWQSRVFLLADLRALFLFPFLVSCFLFARERTAPRPRGLGSSCSIAEVFPRTELLLWVIVRRNPRIAAFPSI